MLVEQLLSEKRDMAREKQETMDALAARHRDAIINLRQRHSESMSRKDALLKESDELVQGFQDMFRELLNEMRGTKVARRKADELSKRAAQAHSRYLEQKLLNDSLTDEIIDTRATSIDLRTKIEEYEAMVDYLYDELDSQKSDFDSIVHFIDSYYQEELESLTPKHIRKHCVPNSSGKGNIIRMHCYHKHMFLLLCYCL
jgi:sugar-specific transcriptional regulator TrmB